MADARHHLCLTLPNLVEGNQRTAGPMQDEVLEEPLPTVAGRGWAEGICLCGLRG